MATMGGVLQQRLARSAEAMLRHAFQLTPGTPRWLSMTVDALARRMYDERIQGSPYTYIQYRNIANSVIRNARDADTMIANPSMTVLDLVPAPGQPPGFPIYEYRSVLAGYNRAGEEVFSTLVYTYSDQPLNAQQVAEDAYQQYQHAIQPPGFNPSGPPDAALVTRIESYLVSAGKR